MLHFKAEFTLLIARSFNRHGIDVARDTRLTESDIIYFIETEFHSSADLQRKLEEFEIIYNKNEDKFQRITTCLEMTLMLFRTLS